ncbi:MAG: acetyl-CoA carboxylase biotin carboxyl carrier protein [Candidatus Gastranaerophilales bacterium]|nr:acetyl-CoA carboxylase biotin carboxyl carrier protein [Candidatus Gastranaerophilales bacterium]
MKTDIDYIKKIADVMDEKSIIELSLEDGSQKISIKKGSLPERATVIEKEVVKVQEPKAQAEVQNSSQKQLTPITSPMVGTFYNSASPDEEPFVRVGDIIKPGQVVCIIEAMKLMNEIEADISGKVAEICVENGQTIEFGQILMYIE